MKKKRITAKQLARFYNIDVESKYYNKDGKWFQNLKSFPGALFDEFGFIIFSKESFESAIKENNIKSNAKTSMHVPKGISTLSDYVTYMEYSMSASNILPDYELPLRTRREINLIRRDQALVKEVKELHKNKCQVCNNRVSLGGKRTYSEVHHLIPLGQPHNGPDEKANMICVCPNCHVQLDYFAIELNLNDINRLGAHVISEESINYHNEKFNSNNKR